MSLLQTMRTAAGPATGEPAIAFAMLGTLLLSTISFGDFTACMLWVLFAFVSEPAWRRIVRESPGLAGRLGLGFLPNLHRIPLGLQLYAWINIACA